MELIQRPRRLRGSDAVRRLCRETRLSPDSLIYPIFVDETLRGKRPIEALPGQFHYGLDAVCEAVSDCLAAGVTHCILFGLPREKDAVGSSAWAKHGVVQEAIRAIRTLGAALEHMTRGSDQRIELELALFSLSEPPQQRQTVPVQAAPVARAAQPAAVQPFAAAPAVPPRLSLMGRLGSGLSSEKTKAYPAWIQPTISSRIRMASRRAAPA